MSDLNFNYPANPVNVPDSVTEPKISFKKEVTRVMGNILLFFIVYIILFLLSIGLIIACFYGGFAIIVAVPRLVTILAGLGLIGLGVMVFVFLIKFLFAVTRYDRSGIIEVKEEEQPKLFAFIRQLTKDTQTPFPKKIFISPEVNACVFYDSSFWSMFLPIKKNLQIGLGLVNSLNVSEFKAVMAHEFGHFSQRSMKLGSFVYNVNRIIHNMLFENKGYADFLSSWGSISGILAIFANITVFIAQGIQYILRQMYGLINKGYMRLSREMEFHADAVAASVSGGNNLVTALHRVEMADYGYNYTLEKCNELYRQKKISANIYSNQVSVFQKIAMDFKLPVENGVPVVNDDFLRGHKLSRINYKDQWASHPTTEDREEQLLGLGVTVEPVHKSAWILFENVEQLQTQLTQKIYENAVKSDDIVTINEKEFNEKINEETKTFSFPDEYKNFYDARQVVPINESDFTSTNGTITLDDLLSAENISLPKQIKAIASDIEVLKAIGLKHIQVKTFDFDGIKYGSGEAASVAEKLEIEHEQLKSRLQNIDKQLIQFFYRQALTKENDAATELKEKYMAYFRFRNKADDFLKQINTMLESLQRIYSGETLTIEVIDSTIGTLKNIHEPLFKDWLKYWLSVDAFALDQETKATAEKFITSDYKYFAANSFFDNELIELNKLCNDGWSSVSNFLFLQFKSILELQLRLK
jgi:Zn-dependent protease with chaperone function